MKKFIKTFDEKNYAVKDLLKLFKNEFTAPAKTMETYSLTTKSFGFRDYTVIIDNGLMRIYEDWFDDEGEYHLIIKFVVDTTNFATWGDFEKYLRRK